jgi:hypothetical protein
MCDPDGVILSTMFHSYKDASPSGLKSNAKGSNVYSEASSDICDPI